MDTVDEADNSGTSLAVSSKTSVDNNAEPGCGVDEKTLMCLHHMCNLASPLLAGQFAHMVGLDDAAQ